MSKTLTIIESMCAITEKMRSPDNGGIVVNPATTRRASKEIAHLKKVLDMNTMQVLILTAIVQKSARYRIDGDDIATYLNLEYLKFLTFDKDMQDLRKRGYIRLDKEYNINIPCDVLKGLKENRPLMPEPLTGLSTGRILTRLKKYLDYLDDDDMDTSEFFSEIQGLIQSNPDTSIARACDKYLDGIGQNECIVFFALLYRYWFCRDDMVGWHNLDDYFDDDDFDILKDDYNDEIMDLQRRKIIEYAGSDGMFTKDYFHIVDSIKEEVFEDVGGLRGKKGPVSASRRVDASSIAPKELFYNPLEKRQVEQLDSLMSEERFNGIRSKMKEENYRTGFTCLFYGAPGTGKTETVYQIARRSGRDLFVVDVSQIKSCWVGESEKNIKEVFSRYRECVSSPKAKVPILLFNEADAIFGIRSEGAGSAVDKMENSIQNIILQEMEDLDGILIATTNLTCNLDKAFERRFLYKVRFEKPSVESRSRIWRSMIPELSEGEAVQLATDFDFSGGQIENISRKRKVCSLISGDVPGYEKVREYCSEEGIAERTVRRIGF